MKIILALLTLALLITTVSAYPIYVATGDPVLIQENIPGGSCWFFPTTGIKYDRYEYDFPPITSIENETVCSIPGDITENLVPGEYTMIYQEPVFIGNKTFKDVSWIDDTLISSFAKTEPIDEEGKQAPDIMNDLKMMIETNQFNTINSETIFIEKPEITLDQISQTHTYGNVYTASGTSNCANGTPIIIKIDETRYFSQHNSSFIYNTTVIRESNKFMGTWSIDMIVPTQDMPTGWHDISIYSHGLIITSRFKIDEIIWSENPLPTQYVKYLSDGDIAPVIVNVTVTQIVDHYTDRWFTATPTPDITDALGGIVEYPYKSGDQIPGWIALLALIGIAGLVLMRDWKWKQ